MTTTGNDLGGLLRAARQRAGLSQYAAANRLGVLPSVVSRWESGQRTPEMGTLTRLADLYDIGVTGRVALIEALGFRFGPHRERAA